MWWRRRVSRPNGSNRTSCEGVNHKRTQIWCLLYRHKSDAEELLRQTVSVHNLQCKHNIMGVQRFQDVLVYDTRIFNLLGRNRLLWRRYFRSAFRAKQLGSKRDATYGGDIVSLHVLPVREARQGSRYTGMWILYH